MRTPDPKTARSNRGAEVVVTCWADGEVARFDDQLPRVLVSDRPESRHITTTLLSLTRESTHGGGVCELSAECPRCNQIVTSRQRRVVDVVEGTCMYHLACYEAWYFGRFVKPPRLRLRLAGDRKEYEVVRPRTTP